VQVQEIMIREPACCGPDARLNDVAKLMVRHATNSIPVVGNPSLKSPLLGILTDRDIVCRAVAVDKNPLDLTAKECMTRPALILKLEQDVAEAGRLMERERARRVPVVDENGRLCGIITQSQITRAAPSYI
jgi:CBS domain-containing protein